MYTLVILIIGSAFLTVGAVPGLNLEQCQALAEGGVGAAIKVGKGWDTQTVVANCLDKDAFENLQEVMKNRAEQEQANAPDIRGS